TTETGVRELLGAVTLRTTGQASPLPAQQQQEAKDGSEACQHPAKESRRVGVQLEGNVWEVVVQLEGNVLETTLSHPEEQQSRRKQQEQADVSEQGEFQPPANFLPLRPGDSSNRPTGRGVPPNRRTHRLDSPWAKYSQMTENDRSASSARRTSVLRMPTGDRDGKTPGRSAERWGANLLLGRPFEKIGHDP